MNVLSLWDGRHFFGDNCPCNGRSICHLLTPMMIMAIITPKWVCSKASCFQDEKYDDLRDIGCAHQRKSLATKTCCDILLVDYQLQIPTWALTFLGFIVLGSSKVSKDQVKWHHCPPDHLSFSEIYFSIWHPGVGGLEITSRQILSIPVSRIYPRPLPASFCLSCHSILVPWPGCTSPPSC